MYLTHLGTIQVKVEDNIKLTPCSPGDPGAKEMTWDDIDGEALLEPLVDFKDFVKAIKSSRPTVADTDLKRNAEWTKEFGSEGN